MKVVMIHEVEDWMLDIDLSDIDIITFDDGLYSQYKHYKHFLKFNKPLIFFISTQIVCPEDSKQNEEVLMCSTAHQNYFDYGDTSNYMKWSQIHEINNTENCSIGGHSHSHPRLKGLGIRTSYKAVNYETDAMMSAFGKQKIKIKSFCYPYNEYINGYRHILLPFGVEEWYGDERIAIEDLR